MSDPVKTLTTVDYVVFSISLAVSAAIGIFFGFRDRKAKASTEDYLMGGRSMQVIPVALSLCVSFLSAITVLGTPAEFYNYGTMYWWFVPQLLVVAIISAEIYIPMFYKLRISSTFEYLERRFNKYVRKMSTGTYMLQISLYTGIVIYAPSLALNAVTGFSLWGSIAATGGVCILYTAVGGLKAVIWTDVFQAVIMLMGILAILIQGSIEEGGFGNIWKIAEEGGRTEFLYIDADPRYRYTIWGIMIAGTFLSLGSYAVGQSQVQRYLSCKSEKQAKIALYLNWIGVALILSLSMMNGAVAYAYYHDCDPIEDGKIHATDQIIPYLALDLFQNQPGLPGLIISAIFSGSISTVSSNINALSCVALEDIIKPATNWSEKQYTWVSKGLVVLFGLNCILVAYIASVMGGLIEAALSVLSLVSGPLVGLFTLGMMFPFANSWGGFFGLLSGLCMTVWVYVGSIFYPTPEKFLRQLPVSTDGCPVEVFNTTYSPSATPQSRTTLPATTGETTEAYPAIADFYNISYIYYSCLGFLTTLTIGLVASLLSGGWRTRLEVDPNLIHFFFDYWLFQWLPESFRVKMRCGLSKEETKDDLSLKALEDEEDIDSNSIKKEPLSISSSMNDGYDNKSYRCNDDDSSVFDMTDDVSSETVTKI